MSYYNQSLQRPYRVLQTPFNNPGNFNAPVLPRNSGYDPVQRRMTFILIFVGLLTVTAVTRIPSMVQTNLSSQVINSDNSQSVSVEFDKGQTQAPETIVLSKNPEGISPIFSPQVKYWESQIISWANLYNLDPDIVATIMQIESCGDPQAGSSAGAQGLFQVMPFHFSVGEAMLDPDTNANRGLSYYVDRLAQTGGNIYQAFAGYNGGHVAAAGNWNTWANETQRYYTWSKGIYDDAKSGLSESPTLAQWMQAGGASLCQQASIRLNLK